MFELPNLYIFSNTTCNFHCANCSCFCHKHKEEMIQNVDELLEPLKFLQTYAKIKLMAIFGGEATLHPDIENFIKSIRQAISQDTVLELISNGWWMPDEDKFGHLWKLIDKLGQGIHPELLKRLPVNEIRACFGRIRKKYKIITNLYVDSSFVFFGFSDIPNNNRKKCRFDICTMLLPNGKLSRCSILCKVPPHLASNAFVQCREESYFDIYQGNADSLGKWLTTTPKCCQYCTGDTLKILHFKSPHFGNEIVEQECCLPN